MGLSVRYRLVLRLLFETHRNGQREEEKLKFFLVAASVFFIICGKKTY